MNFLPCTNFPQTRRLIIAASCEKTAVGGKSKPRNKIGMADEGLQKFPCFTIPYSRCIVCASCGNRLPVWRKGNYMNSIRMPNELESLPAS